MHTKYLQRLVTQFSKEKSPAFVKKKYANATVKGRH